MRSPDRKTANPLHAAKAAAPAASAKPAKPAKPPKAPRDPAQAQQLDGEGKPYITLAQLLKKLDLASTGGAAKHAVRAGGITVNGQPEDRPGRKLHQGDTVVIDGKTATVELAG